MKGLHLIPLGSREARLEHKTLLSVALPCVLFSDQVCLMKLLTRKDYKNWEELALQREEHGQEACCHRCVHTPLS